MINKKSLWFLTLFSLILVLSVYYITMPSEMLLPTNGDYSSETKKETKQEETKTTVEQEESKKKEKPKSRSKSNGKPCGCDLLSNSYLCVSNNSIISLLLMEEVL